MTRLGTYAKNSLQKLVEHVFTHMTGSLQGITYQELAKRIDRLNKNGEGHGHGMGKVLGDMGHCLQEIEGEWGEPIPHIQSLVINKAGPLAGLPDKGIKEFWPSYPDLTKKEKLNKVRVEYARIMEFGSRWNKVLKEMGLEDIKFPSATTPSPGRRFGGGGESIEQLALKRHVCNNPAIVGASEKDEGVIEYPFPSLDTVDVLFKSPTRWIGVEVKSRLSDRLEDDYERGIYQCVKYRALLEAMSKDPRYPVPSCFKVVLLLEKKLPEKYRGIAKTLGVDVVEEVFVPGAKP